MQEFSIEIPDKQADAIHSSMLSHKVHYGTISATDVYGLVDNAVEYILGQPDGVYP